MEDLTIQALRSDLALQIARHARRSGQSQAAAARQLDIPQPTLSQIMNGKVERLSLELLIRIAVRGGLPVVLQTGTVAEEAGVYVSGELIPGRSTGTSRLADEARRALMQNARNLSPEQRLEAHVQHTELVTALHRAGQKAAGVR